MGRLRGISSYSAGDTDERIEIEGTILNNDQSRIVIQQNDPADFSSPTIPDLKRPYQIISLTLSVVFAIVGLVFLFFPVDVIVLFNDLSRVVGMVEAPVEDSGFYLILAEGYMYVVAFLAYLMYCKPDNSQLLLVLINAKSVSSALSFLFFAFRHPYLIFLANGIVDGAIASGLFLLRRNAKGMQH